MTTSVESYCLSTLTAVNLMSTAYAKANNRQVPCIYLSLLTQLTPQHVVSFMCKEYVVWKFEKKKLKTCFFNTESSDYSQQEFFWCKCVTDEILIILPFSKLFCRPQNYLIKSFIFVFLKKSEYDTSRYVQQETKVSDYKICKKKKIHSRWLTY